MIQELLARLARSLSRRRAAWTAGLLGVAALSVWLGSRLRLGLDSTDLMPAAYGPTDSLDRAILDRYGRAGRVIVFLESPDSIPTEIVARLFPILAGRLEQLDAVQSVQARLAPRLRDFLERHGPDRFLLYLEPGLLEVAARRLQTDSIEHALHAWQERERAIADSAPLPADRDPLNLAGLVTQTVERATGTSRIQHSDGFFTIPGHRLFFMSVQPAGDVERIEQAEVLVTELGAALASARVDPELAPLLEGRRLAAAGRPVSYVYAFRTIYSDIRRVAVASMLVVFGLLALFYRRLVAPLVLILPILMGLAVTAAGAALLFGTLSVVAWVFIAVLVGIGVDFGIHIAAHYWVHGEPGGDRARTLASALRRPGRGVVLGAMTSAAAFVSLQVLSYPVMTQVAWLTGLGLLAILASSLTVLPLALSYTAPGGRSSADGRWHAWGQWFYRTGRAWPRASILAWVLLIAGAALATRYLVYEPHPWKLTLRGNPHVEELDRLHRQLGSSFTPLLMVSRGASEAEAIATDREATRRLQRVIHRARITTIESLSRWLPAREDQEANLAFIASHHEVFSPTRFERDFRNAVGTLDYSHPYLLDRYLPGIARFLRPDARLVTMEGLRSLGLGDELDRHLLEHSDGVAVVSYIYLQQFPWTEGAVNRFLDAYTGAEVDQLAGVSLLGDALRSSVHSRILRRDALLAFALAMSAVIGILWLAFRRLRDVVVCLVPVLSGVAAAIIIMAVFHIELNQLTLAIAPILIGIGVDDGIHMVNRLRSDEAPLQVLHQAGSSVTMTTITTAGAFLCLGLARYGGIREVGWVGAAGIVVCLLASLHLIPLCYPPRGRPSPDPTA